MHQDDQITRDDLLEVLQRHIGAGNGATARLLVQEIKRDLMPDLAAERRVRKLVVELRKEGHHICAHPSRGYFIAATDKELEETCEFLRHRAMTSLAQLSAMTRTSIPDLVGQRRLPS